MIPLLRFSRARDGVERAARHRFEAKLRESMALRYALAPVCIAVVLLLHLSALGAFLHPTGLFVAGIVAAAWFGGAGPGFAGVVRYRNRTASAGGGALGLFGAVV